MSLTPALSQAERGTAVPADSATPPPTAATAATAALVAGQGIDWEMVARIREEGLQRSKVMDTASYISDVLGARLTLSEHMKRAQAWATAEMERIGERLGSRRPFNSATISATIHPDNDEKWAGHSPFFFGRSGSAAQEAADAIGFE